MLVLNVQLRIEGSLRHLPQYLLAHNVDLYSCYGLYHLLAEASLRMSTEVRC